MTNTISFILILFSTLIVVFVLFKFFKSEASKTDKGFRLKGAAAGFVVILGFVWSAFTQIYKTIPVDEHNKIINKWKPEKWTISAEIDDPTIPGIMAGYDPPEPIVQINTRTRKIILSDVQIIPEYGYPTIIFSCNDYYPVSFKIDENKNTVFDINKVKHIIKIKTPIILEKINQ